MILGLSAEEWERLKYLQFEYNRRQSNILDVMKDQRESTSILISDNISAQHSEHKIQKVSSNSLLNTHQDQIFSSKTAKQ